MNAAYAAYPQAAGPPVRVAAPKKKVPVLPVLAVLALLAAGVAVYVRFFRKAASTGTVTLTTAAANKVSQATNGTPAVSAAAGGGAFAAPAPAAAVVLETTPAQAVAAAAASPAATSSAVSSTSTSSGPTLTAYKNTTTPGPAGSGLCLSEGGPNGSAALYWCYGGAPQKWAYNNSTGALQGNSSGNCLAASGTTPGSAVISKACNTSDPNQAWNYSASGFGLRGTGSCMDSTTLSNGATMSLNPCSGGASQTYQSA